MPEVDLSVEPVVVTSLAQLTELMGLLGGDVYVRYSAGPEADHGSGSIDGESGCELPGLSVNPLTPEPWWDRPVEQWAARQLCQYGHLRARGRAAWVLVGDVVGRGPDCEPLLDRVRPVARIDDAVLDEASEVYRTAFAPGRH